ncbi:MAG: RhuM family protein [Saprospiraceae bacterium]
MEIYTTPDGLAQIEVRFEKGTAWATQKQLTNLFERDRTVITRHINNVFEEGELDEKSNVQILHISGSDRPVKFYSLDVIISVGYRVKSFRGTQFRQWATQRLKDYLLEGIAVNERRLAQKNQEIRVLHDGIRIISRAIEDLAATSEYEWLQKFSVGLQLLDDYDHERLDEKGVHSQEAKYPSWEEYMDVVEQIRTDFNSGVFGLEKDGGFHSAVNQIRQNIGGYDVYPSIEEKAAMLLYLVVKNHAFVDGNKRIAAACFLLFLERNGLLRSAQGKTIISNEALASLTLFIASSKAEEMETVKRLLVSVLNRSN